MSADGGLSWNVQAIFGSASSSPVVSSVSCADSDHCVALFPFQPSLVVYMVNRVWKTAGSLPAGNYTLWTLSCSTATVCTAAGHGSTEIAQSQDAGNTWTSTTNADTVGALANLSCVKSGSCWLPWDVEVSHSVPGALIDSNFPNGQWTRTGGLPDGYHASQISCTGIDQCMLATTTYFTGSSGYLVFTTSDGGATWTPRRAPAEALLGVSCISATTCWAISGDWHVYETTDGAGG